MDGLSRLLTYPSQPMRLTTGGGIAWRHGSPQKGRTVASTKNGNQHTTNYRTELPPGEWECSGEDWVWTWLELEQNDNSPANRRRTCPWSPPTFALPGLHLNRQTQGLHFLSSRFDCSVSCGPCVGYFSCVCCVLARLYFSRVSCVRSHSVCCIHCCVSCI